ncbi:sugar ABC transporter permease [Lachnospiraceae bacterium]|uniref:ABC transporter permease n=1 Tax=Extibacter sp. GGCC_0201 TaxID=2731209 RepID=UPI001AA16E4C|nr:ABC transporter permease [Extibacter sp. GGCC_0201]MBO1721897.1 ABC transporter permease [Extibacter sp. GGCC_0201]BDF35046.1 sugar ABC transporter permease [Lachnospiraceae bacterium]BDF39047.1 sugar ABC transporter permease [Lachnospiraceae bacterium]
MDKKKISKLINDNILILILLVLCAVLSFIAPNFLQVSNLLNVVRNVSFQAIIALGMTMVIISGEIDLSVGSGVAFYGCLVAYITQKLCERNMDPLPAIMCGFIVALLAGLVIGVLVSVLRVKFNVPTFITTLALMTILKGMGFLISGGYAITSFPLWFNVIGGGYIAGHIPFPALILVIICAIVAFIMSKMELGRAIYAVGSNSEAARLSGISVFKVKTFVLCATCVLTVISGTMIASQIMSGTPTVATGWEMNVISSVIIGGASLNGGSGTVKGTIVGSAFLGVILNGMTLMGTNEYWQYVVRGALILCAVLINNIQANRKAVKI